MSIKAEQDMLFEEWKKECDKFIPDGVVDEDAYKNSKYKILYLLKEVNGGEDWDLSEYIKGGGRPATWDNIARWTEGILNLDTDYDWSYLGKENEKRRIDYLKKICAVNVKKTSGTYVSNGKLIDESTKKNKEFLKKQIDIYEPDIVICCGTSGAYSEIYEVNNSEWKYTHRGIPYLKDDNRIVISYLHPMARTRNNILYYSLTDAIKEIVTS